MKRIAVVSVVVILLVFFGWRFLRPMNIFIVEEKIAWPIDTSGAPALFKNLSAETCGACHQKIYSEWKTAIHSKAWTDPYFQADLKFDNNQFICRLCHTPLDRQLPSKILGYRDENKWQPILAPNPAFDVKLQHEGVTCAVCHLRKGKILGVLGITNAPHPVKKLDNPNRICIRCHLIKSEKFGVFVKFPPCGTVAEINQSQNSNLKTSSSKPNRSSADQSKSDKVVIGSSGELSLNNIASLNCVGCHMPLVQRPLVVGGKIRSVRRHLWRGGHDPQMVKKALSANFIKKEENKRNYIFLLTLVNSGATHYFPTGTPDRHLSVTLRAFDQSGQVMKQKIEILRRNTLWRPFIIDLSDTRLQPGKPREIQFKVSKNDKPVRVEVRIRYHLLDEKRRKRINYNNKEPISYNIYQQEIVL